ncbi:unnamed protein product, partial [Musa hybrid cultivar]
KKGCLHHHHAGYLGRLVVSLLAQLSFIASRSEDGGRSARFSPCSGVMATISSSSTSRRRATTKRARCRCRRPPDLKHLSTITELSDPGTAKKYGVKPDAENLGHTQHSFQ